MTARASTLITLATYNEIDNLPLLIDAIHAEVPEADILVIDDGSPDGTGQWCDEKAAADPRVGCLHREGKLGLGTAIITGMKYAIEHDYEYVLNMDADFSHHPRHLRGMIAGMQPDGAAAPDAVVGSRYVAGGGTQGWPLKRKLMSRMVNLYARWMLGLRCRDCSGSFRCYRTAQLAKVDFDAVRSRGYSFQEEILWRLKRTGARFTEFPIVFADRERGQSKIDGREAVEALWIIFRLGLTNWIGV
ncbi:MAG: polyprenol monophosphomannose synthase [Planctomycetales bacterium]|nr:polyprenol monophosphomannose synthase [Planctomycetales bacterium]